MTQATKSHRLHVDVVLEAGDDMDRIVERFAEVAKASPVDLPVMRGDDVTWAVDQEEIIFDVTALPVPRLDAMPGRIQTIYSKFEPLIGREYKHWLTYAQDFVLRPQAGRLLLVYHLLLQAHESV